MIEFVKTEDVLPLRSKVLRSEKTFDECVFPGDENESTFHLANIQDGEVVCTATFHLQKHPDFKGNAYQLRGMATSPGFQGKGIGKELLQFAIVYLRESQADYLWCKARKAAYSFYLNQGFEFISDEFEIAEIGLHRAMYLKIS